MMEFNIALAGVGGQGTLLAAEAIGAAAVRDGLNVRVSEIHGMAQRGGAVFSSVRIGDAVFAPMILPGRADVLLGFELLETLRNLVTASEKTLVIVNSARLIPPEVAVGKKEYPSIEEVGEKIRCFTRKIIIIDAEELSTKAGSNLTQNSVMLGALAAVEEFPVKDKSLLEALLGLVPGRYAEVNVEAFKLGYASVRDGQLLA